MKKHLLTVEGLQKIKLELRNLVEVQRPAIIKEIQQARDQGDLSENSDYDASKARQTVIESRIQELQDMLQHYELIQENQHDNDANKVVSVGNKVSLINLKTNETMSYEIVGFFDTDPENHKISNDSPLAKSILGNKIDDVVEVRGIPNPYKVKIIAIN
ncbi:Transcription elongation factor GreA [[Mycoplasma] cavipharyngis]|uniref:transcription elongation factor GreA n=1 Tax=[Mycoplasma] cavipharyngis TaxID=92757 RepID=UPI003704ABC0